MRIRILSPAQHEIAQAAARFDEYSHASARGFLGALQHTLDLLADAPLMGSAIDGDTRQHLVPRYRFAVIYRVTDAEIVVIALAHTSREPGYWRNRR